MTTTLRADPSAADLRVDQTHYYGPVPVGSNLLYTITVTNAGPSSATALIVTNHFPASASFVDVTSVQGTCGLTNGEVVCALAALEASTSWGIGVTVVPQAEGPLTNIVSVSSATTDPDTSNNLSVLLGQALVPPQIVTPPVKRSVLEGASYQFSVIATGSSPLLFQWRKGGSPLAGATNTSLLLTAITTNQAGDYSVSVDNAVGSVTSAPVRLTVRLLTDPAYPAPQGGWTYRYTGDAASNSTTASLDGTWVRPSSLDSWAGDTRGAGNGVIGGLSISNGVMTMEDAQTSGVGFNNRRFYFTHDLTQDTSVTNANTLLNDGVTLTFRTRLTPPTDPWIELTNAPNGWVNNSDGKGIFGLRQAGAGGMIVGFSLNMTNEDLTTSTTFNFGQPGLHMNSLNGNTSSSFVDPGEGGTLSLLPLDPTVFHEFWITIQDNGGAPGTHTVSIYRDGATTPTSFNITAGIGGPDGSATNYLALGLGSAAQRGSVDVDFFGYRPGVMVPSEFNQPPGISLPPQSQFVTLGDRATFNVGVTGTPPFAVQWYRDGVPVTGGTNFSITTGPVGTNDQFAAYTVIITNECGAATSAPPALVLLLAPPLITAQPVNLTVTNGDLASFTVSANSATTPSYQWRFNGSAISGATNIVLNLPSAGPAQAGNYDVLIQNSSGSITSTVATLTILLEDFGDAPGAGYATLRSQGGARHLITTGIYLGSSVDGEMDGQPTLSANGDDLAGTDDEDGVRFVSGPNVGQTATLEVVASTNGIISVWLDLNRDGDWADNGEQVVTNAAVVPGTNLVQFLTPLTASIGNSYTRVRFSTVGGLSVGGPARDGEVEDLLVGIGGAADVAIHSVQAPPVATTNAALNYSIVLTNIGPTSGGNVTLSNALPAGVTFVSALPSQGSCGQAAGIVTCNLGLLAAQSSASVVVTVQPTATGPLTNRLAVSAVEFDPVLSNNTATVITTGAVPPAITSQPTNRTTTNGSSATFDVTASGTAPLVYQWRRNGTNVSGGTNATLLLSNVSAADAGNYTCLVTNVAGSAVSDAAVLTVLVGPQIVTSPSSRTNLAGSTAVFQVQASGTAPLGYQWFFQATNALAAQTGATLTLPSVQLSNAGPYQVAISNQIGSITSAPANLVIVQMDLGDAPASYRTLVADDGARHTLVAGVRLGTLIDFEGDGQPDAAALGDDTAGADDEDGVILPASIFAGVTNGLSVIASTNGILQAWLDLNRDGSWTNAGEQILTNRALVPGTNNLIVSIPPSAVAGLSFARFRFSTISNLTFQGAAPDGEVEDYAITIVANADVAVANVIAPSTIAVGTEFTYAIIVTNLGPATASSAFVSNTLPAGVEFVSAAATQGSCSPVGGTVVCPLGQINPSSGARVDITVVPTSAGSLSNVARIFSTASDPSPANNVVTTAVNALDPPVITAPPQNQTVTNGGVAQFTVTATGSQLQYQWRRASTNLPGATNSILTLANAQTSDAASYQVLVSNVVGTALSSPVTLTVLVPMTITTQPSNQTVVKGATATLNVGVTGSGPITYQWEFNGSDLPEGNVAPLVLTNVQPSRAGTYRVRVTNPIGTVISSNAVLTVLEPPVFTVSPQSTTNQFGTSTTLTAAAIGTSPITYQWYFNQSPLNNQTNTSLTLSNLQLNQSGNYTVVATNVAGSATSQVAVVLVIEIDFGDAPESLGYPTTLTFDGARHRIVPGIRLGNLIDRELDGQPTIGATGDNLAGSADEDGVIFSGPLLRGYSSPLQIIASTNGYIDAWIDFNLNGTWVDPGEKALVSQPVVAGTNSLVIPIAAAASPGSTYARFRFSSAGGLASTGFAPDGEVEDYLVTIQQAADVGITMVAAPNPVMVQSNLVYTMTVTNNGPATANLVSLTNILPGSVSFISVSTSTGSCSQSGGIVRCSLGNFGNGASAVVTLTVRPNAAGSLSNQVSIYTSTPEGAFANNTVSHIATVFTPPAAFSNATTIAIADATTSGPGQGSPYPSVINVSGLTGVVQKVTVTLLNLSHTYADDLDVLLVGPGGETVFLLSDVGGNTPLSGINLTLDDEADITLPNTGTILSGSYRPTTFESGSDFFPAPAPAGPYGTTLSGLRGINPNGAWSLYVVDDLAGDVGAVAGGWRLNVSTSNPMSDLAAAVTAPLGAVALNSNLVFTAFVTNRGPAAAMQVRLTNTLPVGVSFLSAAPSQGGCAFSNGVVNCALGPLAPNSVASMALSCQPLAVGTISNSVIASADEIDFVPADNRASTSALVRLATDVALLQTTVTNLVLLSNDVVYTIVVTNRGPNAASAVVVSDPLLPGVSFVSATSSKGSCGYTNGQVDCVIGSLAINESATIALRTHPSTPGMYTNVVSATLTEIDSSFANNRATNVCAVVVIADLAVTLGVTPSFVAVSNQVTWTALVTNRGPSTADFVVLTNILPAGVAFISATSSTGSCVNASGLISCNLGSLSNGSSARVTIVGRADTVGTLSNMVGVSGVALDETTTNNTALISVAVEQPPFISVPPDNRVVTNGGSTTFQVTAGGTGPFYYQWRQNAVDIAGATNASLVLSNIQYAARGNYAVQVSNRVGVATSPPALLTVLVPPTISDIGDLNLNEDQSSGERPFTVQDVDSPPEQLTLEIDSSNPTLLPATNVFISGLSSDRTVRVVPMTNQTGTVTIGLTVRDTNNLTARDTFIVMVHPVNDPPTVPVVAAQETDEDQPLNVIVAVSDVDNDPADLVLTAVPQDTTLVPTNGVSVTGTGTDRTVRFTPGPNQFGSTIITLFLRDTNNATVSNSFTLTVRPVNDPPVIDLLPDVVVIEDFGERSVRLTGVGSGATNELQTLTVTASSSDPTILPHPTVSYTSPDPTGTLIFHSANNATGMVTVTVTVMDDAPTNATMLRTFQVTVLATNDPPVLTGLGDRSMDEDTILTTDIGVFDVDNAATNITVEAHSSNVAIVPDAGLSVSGDGTNRVLRIAPATNQFGNVAVIVTAWDGSGGTNVQSLNLTILPINDAPTLDALAGILVMENSGAREIVLAGITSGPTNEFDTLTITATSSDPTIVPQPTVSYSSPAVSGRLTLAPAADRSGTVTIAVNVDDGGATNRLTARQFTVRVLPSASRPIIRSIARVGNGVTVSFPTISGLTYVVEYTGNLSEPVWSSLPAVVGTGEDLTVPDLTVVGPRFYRLRVQLE